MGAFQRSVCVVCVLALLAGGTSALVHERGTESPLQEKEFVAASIDATPVGARPSSLRATEELASLGAHEDVAFLDTLGGRWRTLLFSLPMIPGSGVGNDLAWDGAPPADDDALAELAWQKVRAFVAENASSLRIDVDQLVPRFGVHDDGNVIQIWADRFVGGLQVRGAGLTAVINHGNLTLMGAELWGDVNVDRLPALSADAALAQVASYASPTNVDGLREDSALVILPGLSASGKSYVHRLAWAVRPAIPGDIGGSGKAWWTHTPVSYWRSRISCTTARRARSRAACIPSPMTTVAPDGFMIDDYPMPFADVSSGGFTDAGGNFSAGGQRHHDAFW